MKAVNVRTLDKVIFFKLLNLSPSKESQNKEEVSDKTKVTHKKKK